MKTRVVLYGENDVPLSTLGENPQEKAKKAWDAVIAVLSLNTTDVMKVESVEVWDDTPQTDCGTVDLASAWWQTDCGWGEPTEAER